MSLQIGDFVVFQQALIKVTKLYENELHNGRGWGYGIGYIDRSYKSNCIIWISEWWINTSQEEDFAELNLYHFESIAVALKKGGVYSRVQIEEVRKFLKEALIWYFRRNNYDLGNISPKTSELCEEIPF